MSTYLLGHAHVNVRIDSWNSEASKLDHSNVTCETVGYIAVLDKLVVIRWKHLRGPIVHLLLAQVVKGLNGLEFLLVGDLLRQDPDIDEVGFTTGLLHVW